MCKPTDPEEEQPDVKKKPAGEKPHRGDGPDLEKIDEIPLEIFKEILKEPVDVQQHRGSVSSGSGNIVSGTVKPPEATVFLALQAYLAAHAALGKALRPALGNPKDIDDIAVCALEVVKTSQATETLGNESFDVLYNALVEYLKSSSGDYSGLTLGIKTCHGCKKLKDHIRGIGMWPKNGE